MATPRSKLIDSEIALHYHLVSRCVRRSFLCGYDKPSRKKYNHRKGWIEQRLFHLAKYFAVEINAHAILSSHFHLVVYYDPLACHQWDDAEVARRWAEAFPPRVSPRHSQDSEALKQIKRDELLADPARLKKARLTLGSLSMFMKYLKQPIAWRANREDNCTGHFFESRFYSGALLSENAVLAAMAYVDLNPVRADINDTIERYEHTSIYKRLQRLERSPAELEEYLGALVSGIGDTGVRLQMTLKDYLSHLQMLIEPEANQLRDDQATWHARVASIKKRQRAYGLADELKHWAVRHGWRRTGDALP